MDKCPNVWKNTCSRESIRALFVSHGAQHLLVTKGKDMGGALANAMIILFLENFNIFTPQHHRSAQMAVLVKISDISLGSLRALVKFYCQRLWCSCLDDTTK